jgi:hypothetical protein
MNSLLFRAQYMRFWLRLRLRDILLTSELVVRNGNSIREQYIPLTRLEGGKNGNSNREGCTAILLGMKLRTCTSEILPQSK